VASVTQQAGQIGGMLRNSAFAQDALKNCAAPRPRRRCVFLGWKSNTWNLLFGL